MPAAPLGLLSSSWSRAADGALSVIRLNLPGPGSLPFLPLELIPRLGFDRELGFRLHLRYFSSGVLAAEDMLEGNAGYAAHGFPILANLRVKGRGALAVAMLSGRDTPRALLVRTDLARRYSRVENLKGASIGVSAGSFSTKTYLQILGEQALALHGVAASDVRWVPMAQNWDSVRSLLVSGSADAAVCEEPFLSRAVDAGLARVLLHFNEMQGGRRFPGEVHIRAVISAPRARMDADERQGLALLKMLAKVLAWMAAADPAGIVEKRGLATRDERAELARLLARYPGLFPRQPRFEPAAVSATGSLLVALGLLDRAADVTGLIDERWSGRS